jgi:hypothetical protein
VVSGPHGHPFEALTPRFGRKTAASGAAGPTTSAVRPSNIFSRKLQDRMILRKQKRRRQSLITAEWRRTAVLLKTVNRRVTIFRH